MASCYNANKLVMSRLSDTLGQVQLLVRRSPILTRTLEMANFEWQHLRQQEKPMHYQGLDCGRKVALW
jgi:hypothetical protein